MAGLQNCGLFTCVFLVCFFVARSQETSNQTASDASTESTKRKIVCLLHSANFKSMNLTPSDIDPLLCTHINYEFAILDPDTYQITYGDPELDNDNGFYNETTELKQGNPELKVLLSLGGWADSTKKYSDLVADPEKRKNFVTQAVAFLKEHNFDGLDVAWEYPNAWQGDIGVQPNDTANFVALLKELRTAFDENGFVLSVSVASSKQEVDAAYDIPAISDTVDLINVMIFDMHGSWEGKTGHHAQFAKLPDDEMPLNMNDSLRNWIDGGADPLKLMAGIPAYGNSFTLQDPENNTIGAAVTGDGVPGEISNKPGFLTFREICEKVKNGDMEENEEMDVGTYAFKGDQWVAYDSLKQMVRKVKFAIDNGFGGILIKDLSGDDHEGVCYQNVTFPLTRGVKLEILKREQANNI